MVAVAVGGVAGKIRGHLVSSHRTRHEPSLCEVAAVVGEGCQRLGVFYALSDSFHIERMREFNYCADKGL